MRFEIIRVRMFEDVGYRYLYMFRVSSYEWWIIDECTDYSGCGNHDREVMEKLVKHYRSSYGELIKYEEYEIPSKIYHLLKNILYETYAKELREK